MIKKFIKVSSCIALILGLSMLGLANNVNAANLPNDATLTTLIPDSVLRDRVLRTINENLNPEIEETDVLKPSDVAELTEISVRGASITSLEGLQYFTQLTSIQIVNSKVKEIPASFVDLQNLEILVIENSEIEKLPDNFTDFTALTTIRLSGNKISDITTEQYEFIAARKNNMMYQTVFYTAAPNNIQFSDFTTKLPSVFTTTWEQKKNFVPQIYLYKPDQESVVEFVKDDKVIAEDGETITIDGSNLDQIGEYNLQVWLTGNMFYGTFYSYTINVVEPLVIPEEVHETPITEEVPETPILGDLVEGPLVNDVLQTPSTNASALPKTGSNEVLAYIGLLLVASLLLVRKRI